VQFAYSSNDYCSFASSSCGSGLEATQRGSGPGWSRYGSNAVKQAKGSGAALSKQPVPPATGFFISPITNAFEGRGPHNRKPVTIPNPNP
jgi:hypothetical protein